MSLVNHGDAPVLADRAEAALNLLASEPVLERVRGKLPALVGDHVLRSRAELLAHAVEEPLDVGRRGLFPDVALPSARRE
jgi:hypothetical protein